MGFRGNNSRTFAEYVELEIALNDDSLNVYIHKRLFSKKGSQVPIKQMRTFGMGQYAFFTGSMK